VAPHYIPGLERNPVQALRPMENSLCVLTYSLDEKGIRHQIELRTAVADLINVADSKGWRKSPTMLFILALRQWSVSVLGYYRLGTDDSAGGPTRYRTAARRAGRP
jgi:hypothetical protein